MRPKIALELMNEGYFLPSLFRALCAKSSEKPFALYGPCDYWQEWYYSLPQEKKSLIYPYHQPLGSSISLERLCNLDYSLSVTATPIHLASKNFRQFEALALWFYYPESRTLYVTLSIFPLTLLTLEQWLTLYPIAQNLSKKIFLTEGSKIYLTPIETGSMAAQHFLSLKKTVQSASSLQSSSLSTLLMEPLSFQTLLVFLKETQPVINKFQLSWFQKKETPRLPRLQGIAKERSVCAYADIIEESQMTPLIEWAFVAGSC